MYHFLVLLQYFGIFALIVEIFYVSRQQSSKLQMALVLLLYSSFVHYGILQHCSAEASQKYLFWNLHFDLWAGIHQ